MMYNGIKLIEGVSFMEIDDILEQIRQMIIKANGCKYEELISPNQALTFSYAKKVFKKRNIDFSDENQRILGIKSESDSLYTNLASVLSDQCVHTIKVAVFNDEANTCIIDSEEFTGSVFKQVIKAYDFLKIRTARSASEKTERQDYPEEALYEALLNAVVHRDYSFSGSVIINVNNKQIEIISIGGLMSGLSLDDIKNGVIQPRNKKLADLFGKLQADKSYGTGIRKIYNLYRDCDVRPTIEATANSFKIILPNMNKSHSDNKPKVKITSQMKEIINYLEYNEYITEEDVQALFTVKKTRSYIIMKDMEKAGLVYSEGRGAEKEYYLKK